MRRALAAGFHSIEVEGKPCFLPHTPLRQSGENRPSGSMGYDYGLAWSPTHVGTGGCHEFRELVVQPLSILKEIVLVPAVELVPIFGGLAVIFFCRSGLRASYQKRRFDGTNVYHYHSRETSSACSEPFRLSRRALRGVGHGPCIVDINFTLSV